MKQNYIFLFIASILAGLLSCSSCRTNINKPPRDVDPWPKPHDGLFVSGADTLRFNGDGQSICWHFAAGMDCIGRQGSGTYAFLFDGGLWRYDAAERLDIFSEEGAQISFGLDVPGSCTDSTICLRRFDIVGQEAIVEVFRRSE